MKTTKITTRRTTFKSSLIPAALLAAVAAGACGPDDPPADTDTQLTPGPTGSNTLGSEPTSGTTTEPIATQTSTTSPPAVTSPSPMATPPATTSTPSPTAPNDGMTGAGDTGGEGGAGGTGTTTPALPTADPTTPASGGAGGGNSTAAGGAGGTVMDMGMGGMTPDTGDPAAVVPSDGCGNANPNTGSSNNPLMASNHQYYVKLPNGYDPSTPHKVMIMFNPTGNPISWAETSGGYEQAAPDAIRVYPHMSNQSSGWQPNETSFFQGLYDAITSNFCIDEARVFAAGESSGGEFAGFLGCEYGDLLRGVAPGAPKSHASWPLDLGAHDCKGNPAAIVIWSPMDNVLSNPTGPQFRDFYHDMNMCGDTTTPVDGYTDNMSNCEVYEGCVAGSPVYFCQHSDPTYNNTYHGWAAFAARMTWEVFSEL